MSEPKANDGEILLNISLLLVAVAFRDAAFAYLNACDNSTVCSDRSCLRCRIADIAFEVERKHGMVSTPSNEKYNQISKQSEAVQINDVHPSACWTLDQIRQAFWKTFHKEGELWFDYLSDEETCEESTRGMWSEFTDNLNASNALVDCVAVASKVRRDVGNSGSAK
jgi:hypothetical protein